jgi:hypothetical protein
MIFVLDGEYQAIWAALLAAYIIYWTWAQS